MTRARSWDYAVHDPILHDLITKWKLTDYEAAERMNFSAQTIKLYREKMGLKANRKGPPPSFYTEQNRLPPPERPNPIALAVAHFGARLVEKPSGYWLDGTPVNSHTLMKRYNQARLGMGQEPIAGPESWRP
jgi:hypothetical protein